MILTLVVAACDNNVIGNKNELLYRLPKDFARMKAITMGKPLLMGRKTHESIGRPLPGRRNIVITRRKDAVFAGCDTAGSLEDAIAMVKGGSEEAIVFGGADIYRQAMPLADRIRLTRIHDAPEGDVLFPDIDMNEWKEVLREEHQPDAEHPVAFTFIDYERVKN